MSAPPFLDGPAQTLDDLNAIFSSIDAGIVMQSASGEIVACNPAAERMLGLTRDQMMGRTSVDPRWRAVREDGSILPGTEHPAMVALATGRSVQNVIMGVHKPDDSLCWISVNAVPILEDGVPVRVVTNFADVTAMRNADLENSRLRQEFESSQRTLAAIRDVQALVIAGEKPELIFNRLLDDLLSASGSPSGFIAEVSCDSPGTPPLTVQAEAGPEWASAARATSDHGANGAASTNLLSYLIRRTVTAGERVVASMPDEPVSAGTAPRLEAGAYLGLPLLVGDELVGMVGLANRDGGYSEELAEGLGSYLSTCSEIIHAARVRRDRDLAERALALHRERMALVLEASGIGHWDWNPATDEALFDERWAAMIGYEPGEIAGNGAAWLRLLHPDDVAATLNSVERHVKGETPEHRAEFRMQHRNGSWVWILAVGRVIERNAQGQVTRIVGVHVDISASKAYEAALAEATAEAQRADRAKSEFLANMSHEIRTPMNGVIGAAHLLLGTSLSEEQREYSETIRRSGEILLALIEDILDLSKIEAERLELEHVVFDPCETIAEVVEFERARATAKGLEIGVDHCCDPLVRVKADPRRTRQVLLNLVSNAVKFTTRGHIVITTTEADGAVRVSVTDTGIGIPADKQSAVFDKFIQADASTTRKFGGTGLGLAISRHLVDAMGGTIGVRSATGEGSTFWFTLPLASSSATETTITPPRESTGMLILHECQEAGGHRQIPVTSTDTTVPADAAVGAPATADTGAPGTLRVLLAEDDEISRFVGRRTLERLGCVVDVAEDGDATLAITAAQAFDLVFMDCNMPGMDGFEATAGIRTRRRDAAATSPDVPIVAVTANAMVGDRERCLDAGMVDYLTKPLLTADVAAAISRWRPKSQDPDVREEHVEVSVS